MEKFRFTMTKIVFGQDEAWANVELHVWPMPAQVMNDKMTPSFRCWGTGTTDGTWKRCINLTLPWQRQCLAKTKHKQMLNCIFGLCLPKSRTTRFSPLFHQISPKIVKKIWIYNFLLWKRLKLMKMREIWAEQLVGEWLGCQGAPQTVPSHNP